MTDPFDSDIERHQAGATVTHAGPFSSIEVPQQTDSLSTDFIDTWVIPFYMLNLRGGAASFSAALKPLVTKLTGDVYSKLFAEANWRPRIVGAYFTAIFNDDSFEEQIGRLLLRSDVCFAGRVYCLALARFNTIGAIEFLRQYLDYYLTRSDLFFDQGEAIGAIAYLDRLNGTELLASYSAGWESFAADKDEGWELSKQIERFQNQIDAVIDISGEVSNE